MSAVVGQHVAARFSAAAESYEQQPGAQQAVARMVAEAATELVSARCPTENTRILEIGCGTGFLTELLHMRFPKAQILAVDMAPGMILEARKRVGTSPRVDWLTADVRDVQLETTYDLVTSSSALHWMQPLDRTLERLAAALRPNGALVFALMVAGTLRELHELRREIAPRKGLPLPLPRPDGVLADVQAAGLQVEHSRRTRMTVRYPSAGDFLRALNRQGVTGGMAVPDQLLSRGELQRLTRTYEERCQHPDGGVLATYEVLFVHAAKPPASP